MAKPEQSSPQRNDPTGDTDALASLRDRIDEVDRTLLVALNERAKLVLEVGRIKEETGASVYEEARERRIPLELQEVDVLLGGRGVPRVGMLAQELVVGHRGVLTQRLLPGTADAAGGEERENERRGKQPGVGRCKACDGTILLDGSRLLPHRPPGRRA